MSQIQRAERLRKSLHSGADSIGNLVVEAFHYLALFGIAAITVWAAISAFIGMLGQEK